MTRLTTEWLRPIGQNLNTWDAKLRQAVGCDLATLAFRAALSDPLDRQHISSEDRLRLPKIETETNPAAGRKAAAITVTGGEGEIGSFASTVAEILKAIGMDAKATESTDIAGLYEAIGSGADLAFMADDDRFIALNLKNGRCGENDRCTALGYLQLLEEYHMKRKGRSLEGEAVLLMGYGRVGRVMYDLLMAKKADITVYDKDESKQKELEDSKIEYIVDREKISGFSLIIDLTSEGDWLRASDIRDDAVIVAPGVPLSVHGEDLPRLEGRIFHDDLEIGTAVMAMAALDIEIPQGGT